MMTVRSLLFVPADSDRKLARAEEAGADALILDLEDAVGAAAKPQARARAAEFLRARPPGARRAQLWVRINPLDSGLALADLVALAGLAPDGVVLPKAGGPADLGTLSHYLDALEAQHGLAPGSTGVLPLVTETPAAVLRIGEYAGARLPRLRAMTWGGEDLAAALGASASRDAGGAWNATTSLARSLALLAAHACGVAAIDTVYVDYRDEQGLRAAARASRAEGFGGRLAIHPAQVPVINEAYLPSPEECERARRIVAAFAASPGAGTVGLDGRMLDRPHLAEAQRLLALAAARRGDVSAPRG